MTLKDNHGQTKPHLLHVYLESNSYRPVSYSIDCPHDDLGDKRPCAVWSECSEHQRPKRPASSEPPWKWSIEDDMPVYQTSHHDQGAVREWQAYNDDWRAWNEQHKDNDGYHPDDDCWVRQYVAEGDFEETWGLSADFNEFRIDGPIKVAWENEGGIEDASLRLHPWQEKADV